MSEGKRVRDWDRLILRLPDGMREEVEQMAMDDCRPLNGQLIWLIKAGIGARKAASNHTA